MNLDPRSTIPQNPIQEGKKMKKLALLIAFILLFSACGKTPAPEVVTNQITKLATVEVTRLATVEVTRLATFEVTRLFVVTATYSGPTETPSPTATRTSSPTPKPTVDQTKSDKGDGSYMVGIEIAPGVWRSSGGNPSEECWIQIKSFSGDLAGIAGDLPGGTIRIPGGQYIVYIGGGSGNKCTWSFLMP
jgi:hypothetical protein